MALNVTVAELYRAAPVLSRISRVKLTVLGAMKLNQLMAIIDTQIEAFETERMAKIKELSFLDEKGEILTHDETDEQGKPVLDNSGKPIKKPNFKSLDAEEEMEAYGETALRRVIHIPFRVKSKQLTAVPGVPNSGYALSVEECKALGRFLSYDDVPKEPDEDIEEGEA